MTNLPDEIEKLKTAPAWGLPAGRSAVAIAKYPDLKIVLMAMKAGSRMERHHADGRISVQVIQGKIRFQVAGGEPIEMGAGSLLTLEQGIEHDVEAMEESAFLLTVVGS